MFKQHFRRIINQLCENVLSSASSSLRCNELFAAPLEAGGLKNTRCYLTVRTVGVFLSAVTRGDNELVPRFITHFNRTHKDEIYASMKMC